MAGKIYELDARDVQLSDGSFLMAFPIGDWSGDGHSQCDEYIVRSKKPVRDVREAHFRAPQVLGFGIEEICGEYEESTIRDDLLQKIRPLGYTFPDSDEFEGKLHPSSKELANLWTFLLNQVDSSLGLEVIDIPGIHFNGYDNQQRHVGNPGYGIFGP